MKKFFSFMLLVAMMVSSVFAIDIAVGGDLDFTHSWNTNKLVDGASRKSENLIGFNVFGDFQYAIVALGGSFTVCPQKYTVKGGLLVGTYTNDKLKNSYVNLRVLGKYPFTVGIAKLYPMAGFQFSFLASSKFDGEKVDLAPEYKKDLHHYYFLLGFGADIFATDNVFIRITPVFGFDMNKPEGYREAKKAAKDAGTKYSMQGYMFNIGIGAGYKF